MRFFSFLFFFVCTFLLSHSTVLAEENSRGIVLSPAFQEILLDTNDKQRDFSLSVTNTENSAVTLRITVFDFGSLDESGGVAFLGAENDLSKKYALASWIRPEKDVFMLESNETKKILVTIENREGLSPGGHYGALLFRGEGTNEEGGTSSNSIALKQSLSSLVFVKKIGGEIYHLELKESKYENNPVLFQDMMRLRFQNSGNVHLIPRGTITVTDPLKRIVGKGVINEESAIILPETFRIYPVALRTIAPLFVPGRYTVDISYRYDGQEAFSSATFSFDFFPFPATLGSLILIAGLGWYGAIYWRKRSKKGKKSSVTDIEQSNAQ